MKSMMQFGEALVRYEGVAHFSLQECDTEFDLSGYFQAAQFASGRLAISAMPTDRPKPSKVAFQHSAEAELSFHARTVDGWTITLGGQKIFSYLMWTLAPFATQPTALDLSAQFMEAKRDGGTQDGYTNVQFVVSNLLWHGPSVKQPEPIELSSQSFEVKVIPVDSYVEVARRLISTHGIEPTALVRIRTHQCHAMPLQSFREFMEELVCVFRLATGNLVDWYYAEAVNHRTKEPVERLHKYAMTGPYSNTIIFRPLRKGYRSAIPKLDLPKLATAFLDDCHQGLEKAILKPLINQFTNACDDTSFLESRGLLASTLTELIAAKTAHKNGESDVIPKVSSIRKSTLLWRRQSPAHLSKDIYKRTSSNICEVLTGAHSDVGSNGWTRSAGWACWILKSTESLGSGMLLYMKAHTAVTRRVGSMTTDSLRGRTSLPSAGSRDTGGNSLHFVLANTWRSDPSDPPRPGGPIHTSASSPLPPLPTPTPPPSPTLPPCPPTRAPTHGQRIRLSKISFFESRAWKAPSQLRIRNPNRIPAPTRRRPCGGGACPCAGRGRALPVTQ